MATFNPVQERQMLDSDVGVRLYLDLDFDESKKVGGLATSADAFITMAIDCLLVGHNQVATQLLERAHQRLIAAIEEHETPQDYAPNGTEALRYHDLAMCNWLLHNIHDVDNLNRFVEHEDRFLNTSKVARNRANLSLTMLGYVNAGAYECAMKWLTPSFGASIENDLENIRNEGKMCYIICRHHMCRAYSEAEVASAIQSFLFRNVNDWLTKGDFLRAAEWMKIVHWKHDGAELSSQEVVLKCYEYLSKPASPEANDT